MSTAVSQNGRTGESAVRLVAMAPSYVRESAPIQSHREKASLVRDTMRKLRIATCRNASKVKWQILIS